jgi:hypothetical protein
MRWAGSYGSLFVTDIYGEAWPRHILSIISLTVLLTLLYVARTESCCSRWLFHTAGNLSAEILVVGLAAADVARALTLYLVGAVTVALIAAPRVCKRWNRGIQQTVDGRLALTGTGIRRRLSRWPVARDGSPRRAIRRQRMKRAGCLSQQWPFRVV